MIPSFLIFLSLCASAPAPSSKAQSVRLMSPGYGLSDKRSSHTSVFSHCVYHLLFIPTVYPNSLVAFPVHLKMQGHPVRVAVFGKLRRLPSLIFQDSYMYGIPLPARSPMLIRAALHRLDTPPYLTASISIQKLQGYDWVFRLPDNHNTMTSIYGNYTGRHRIMQGQITCRMKIRHFR